MVRVVKEQPVDAEAIDKVSQHGIYAVSKLTGALSVVEVLQFETQVVKVIHGEAEIDEFPQSGIHVDNKLFGGSDVRGTLAVIESLKRGAPVDETELLCTRVFIKVSQLGIHVDNETCGALAVVREVQLEAQDDGNGLCRTVVVVEVLHCGVGLPEEENELLGALADVITQQLGTHVVRVLCGDGDDR